MNWKVVLSDIDFGLEESDAVAKVLRSKWLTVGEVTRRFEEEFSHFLGIPHAVALSSGTAALHTTLIALDIGEGDEVIVPSFTFIASVNAILYVRAIPVFADIQDETNLNISLDDIRQKITPNTKALLIVHYGGYPVDMEKIMTLASEYNLKVIEDAAHALGASLKGKKLGTFGDVGCFSFFCNKNMTTGEGGMLVTSDPNIAKRCSLIRSHGMTQLTFDRYQGRAFSYDVVEMGFNYRPTDLSSAIGRTQLRKLVNNNQKRAQLTSRYRNQLRDIAGMVTIPFYSYLGEPSFHIFPILLARDIPRDELMIRLKKDGIQTSIHYPPVHLFTFYRKYYPHIQNNLRVTEDLGRRQVTLPLHPLMDFSQVDYVCQCLAERISQINRKNG